MPTAMQSSATESGYQLKGDRPNLYEKWWVPAIMGTCGEDLVDAAGLQHGEKV